jgi:hypothetical protein
MGSLIDKSLKVWSRDEPPLDILNTPFQHVSSIFTELATKARTAGRAWTKTINHNLHEIDRWVTMKATVKLNDEDQAMLRTVHCGGGVAKVELHAIGAADNTVCDYCGHAICDLDHIIWACPFSKTPGVRSTPLLQASAYVAYQFLYEEALHPP